MSADLESKPVTKRSVLRVPKPNIFLFWFATGLLLSNICLRHCLLKWPASMQFLEQKKAFSLEKTLTPSGFFGISTWPLLHCFGPPISPP